MLKGGKLLGIFVMQSYTERAQGLLARLRRVDASGVHIMKSASPNYCIVRIPCVLEAGVLHLSRISALCELRTVSASGRFT